MVENGQTAAGMGCKASMEAEKYLEGVEADKAAGRRKACTTAEPPPRSRPSLISTSPTWPSANHPADMAATSKKADHVGHDGLTETSPT